MRRLILAAAPRCLVPDLDAPQVALDGASRHHLGRVLRLRNGECVELVDGRGGWARARWNAGAVTIEERRPRTPPPAPRVLAVAPPRPARLEWLVEKSVELGLSDVWLLDSDHAAREVGPGRMQRLGRIADEALLQCRRLHALQLVGGLSLDQALERFGPGPAWLATPPSAADAPTISTPPADQQGSLLLLVGPEGGFSADEQRRARAAGARPVSLGTGVLRVETAALALAVLAGVR